MTLFLENNLNASLRPPELEKPEYIEITGNHRIDMENVRNSLSSDMIIIGESHDDEYVRKFILNIIDMYRPRYFLTEHIQYTKITSKKEFRERLQNLGKDGNPYNRYTKFWLEKLYNKNLEYIGMDYVPVDGTIANFEHVVYNSPVMQSFRIREAQMVKTCNKYLRLGKVLVQVGDTHLRATDEGKSSIGGRSPIMNEFVPNKKVTIFRLARRFQECP